MGLLHQPELAPGPHRDLVDALHRLHREAGRPSLRAIARRAGCSPTTVFHLFTHPRPPAWSLLEEVVTAIGGVPADFRDLWLAATADGARHLPAPGRTIAGRRAELLVVRRHLEAGGGLVVVTGEPGIGRTTLLAAASQQVSTFVARAGGVPVRAAAPFALVSDVLRSARLADDGRWFDEALARCPAFVPPALARIVPEIGPSRPDPEDRFAAARLFAAIESTLAALSSLRPLALVLEDLHWSDPSSRGFVERHVVGGRGVPIVASLSSGESAAADAWLTRVRREAALVLNLAPLTPKETREQLRLLIGPRLRRGDVERVHAVTRGVPLLTEALARSMTAGTALAPVEDLLSPRLDQLDPSARTVLLVAALAERPLPPPVVADATSMGRAELADSVRDLVSRHLLADPYTATDVTVRHPLVSAAVRARLVPGETAPVHRRLASAVSTTAHVSPAEVAGHWRGAGEPREELRWRVAAARAACDGLARDEEALHWRRALDLWPADGPAPADAGITRCELLLELVHATVGSGHTRHTGQARSWLEEALALAPALPERDHALALCRAGQVLAQADPQASVDLADEAIAVLDALDDRVALVRAMGVKSSALRGAGRNGEADVVIDRTLETTVRLGDPALHRGALIERAWHDIVLGRTAHGLRAAREARSIVVEGDPFSDVWLGTYHTDLLLMLCAAADDVADAADPGLAAVREAGIESFVLSTMLLCNVAEARLHAGAPGAASRLVRPRTRDDPRQPTRFLHLVRAWVQVVQGDLEAADRRLEKVASLDFGVSAHRQAVVNVQAMCDLWRGLPARALDRIGAGIDGETVTSWSPYTGSLLCLAARAAADVAAADPGRRSDLAAQLAAWQQQWSTDPLAPEAVHAAAAATRSTWRAELARLHGVPQLPLWVGAAEQWDLVGRPHEAAYSRWRGAEVALRENRDVLAGRLLRRAHAQARGHVPLLGVIDRTRAGAALPAVSALAAPRRAGSPWTTPSPRPTPSPGA
ncbi:AAA family ATPase [Nocardioides sp. STR2]|uniref:AAA family ATPase n=1 Tax=Nocardioides pini TaxID=2975053 RepID=A0ABT4CDN1_9ACTN|nr:AAA family ATPase [Nocardioides pini]MCY4727086.1 AAA family ATPase [Nocardioides pini]